MAKRGFFAEMNYQAQQAEKRRRQQEAQAVRAHNAAVRKSEQAAKAAQRARANAQRASEAERKAAEKEAQRLHVEARTAEVEAMNTELATTYEDIDSLLEATLAVDDYVDLETLKVTATHPPFQPGAVADPTPEVPEPYLPWEPKLEAPAAPSGLSAAFGGKKRHAEAVAQAEAEHQNQLQLWNAEVARLTADHEAAVQARDAKEQQRRRDLAEAEAVYRAESKDRETEAEQRNAELTTFINDLAFDVESAIEEYVGIVLSNSAYPDAFPVDYDHSFDLATRELTLRVFVPEPSALPTVKEFRYVKSKDEVTSTQLSAKAQKDRYSSAVHQVAVRTLHEIFEADRAGKVRSIALTVGVQRTAPATGLPEQVPLVVVAADKETFDRFELANVVPSATLEHLGAALSKSPFDLTPADGRGVRQQGQ